MSNVDRSKWSGGWPERRSPSPIPKCGHGPVEKGKHVGVGDHDALRLARGAGREEDVRGIVAAGLRRDGIVRIAGKSVRVEREVSGFGVGAIRFGRPRPGRRPREPLRGVPPPPERRSRPEARRARRSSPASAPDCPDRPERTRSRHAAFRPSPRSPPGTSAGRGTLDRPARSRARAGTEPGGSRARPASRTSAIPRPRRSRPSREFGRPARRCARAGSPSRRHRREGSGERDPDVPKVGSRDGNVDDQIFEAALPVGAELSRDPLVAADEVGAEGVVVLERPEPVGIPSRIAPRSAVARAGDASGSPSPPWRAGA